MAKRTSAASPARQRPVDAYLAACSALLLAIATNTYLEQEHVDTLLDSMPEPGLHFALLTGLRAADLVPSPAGLEHG